MNVITPFSARASFNPKDYTPAALCELHFFIFKFAD
jgi:hypothetical protein